MFKNFINTNKIYALLSVLFLFLSLIGSVFLVRQNQDLREQAATSPCGTKPAEKCPYPKDPKLLGVNPICDLKTLTWDFNDQQCNQAGRIETCNGEQWCCPVAGAKWQKGPCGEVRDKESNTLTLQTGRKLRLYLVNLITNNTYQITLTNKTDPSEKITLNTGQLAKNQDKIFLDVLTVGQNNQYDISVQLIGEAGPAYGWKQLNTDGKTCGEAANGNALIDVTSYINSAKQQSREPHSIQCWGDYQLGDTTQDYDFNDFMIVIGYDELSVPTLTNTPTATNTPKPSSTIKPSSTPTSTPKPTNTPTATNTPRPTATPTYSASINYLTCGQSTCSSSSPCTSGLVCVKANNGDFYCSKSDYQTYCQSNPGYQSCCTAPLAEGPSPTRIILPSAGIDFPLKGMAIIGSILSLLGILILL